MRSLRPFVLFIVAAAAGVLGSAGTAAPAHALGGWWFSSSASDGEEIARSVLRYARTTDDASAPLSAKNTSHLDDESDESAPGAQQPVDSGVTGPRMNYATRPALLDPTKACSMRVPLCVHAASAAGRGGRAVLDVLASAERAWETLAGALRLAPPDLDPADLAYHLYVVENASQRGVTLLEARDVRSRIDRARAFTVLDASMRAGCQLDALVARELARAVLYRLAPATAEGIARAQTTYLAQLMVPCATAFAVDAVEAFQSHPERAICDARADEQGTSANDGEGPSGGPFLDGAFVFWARTDWAYGRTPGSIVMGAWALGATTTEVGARRWHDEPDAFDILRISFKNALSTGSTLHDLLLDAAIARAFLGSADDGLHQVELRTLGPAAGIRLDWDLPWPTEPRRVAPRAAVQPTGASYLMIHRASAPKASRLRVEIAWEEHALFRWAFVKLDAKGRELGRVGIAARERAIEAQMTLVGLDGVDRILLVGVNVGDPAYRFDPDDEVWEPHSWLVTMASE